MILFPLNDRVIVKPDEAQSVTPGGIIIPDAGREKPHRGTVIAVNKARNPVMDKPGPLVQVGESILYGKYSGNEIEIEGEDYILLREEDIMGVYGERQ